LRDSWYTELDRLVASKDWAAVEALLLANGVEARAVIELVRQMRAN